MAQTTNLELEKEELSDRYSIDRINGNLQKIDVFAGDIRTEIQRLWDAIAELQGGGEDE